MSYNYLEAVKNDVRDYIQDNFKEWDIVDKLHERGEWEQEKYCAAVEYWGAEYVDIDDLDEYVLYANIHDDDDLGRYWVEESGCYDLRSMGTLANYIDFDAFGRDIRLESDGGFTSFGWIERR